LLESGIMPAAIGGRPASSLDVIVPVDTSISVESSELAFGVAICLPSALIQ
jgi:hypothetical protein